VTVDHHVISFVADGQGMGRHDLKLDVVDPEGALAPLGNTNHVAFDVDAKPLAKEGSQAQKSLTATGPDVENYCRGRQVPSYDLNIGPGGPARASRALCVNPNALSD